jgi:hypothetical protein
VAGGRRSRSKLHIGRLVGGGCHGEQTEAAGWISLADMGPTIPAGEIKAMATAVNVVTGKRGVMDHLERCLSGIRS